MKPRQILILLVLLVPALFIRMSCGNDPFVGDPYPSTPVNYSEINTEFDDYNSAFPYYGEVFPLCFSSNRNSSGENYDIIYKLTAVWIDHDDKHLNLYHETSDNLDVYMMNQNLNNGMDKINTSADEFGPMLIPGERLHSIRNDVSNYQAYIILFSSNKEGKQDIYFSENYTEESYSDPVPVQFLNSKENDAYPALNLQTYPSEIYFASDRNTDWDIYRIATDSSNEILPLLKELTQHEPELDTVLSTSSDDTCPYIIGDFMVFASNREGGFGGYDLYYSSKENGKWTTPVNMGEVINSEYNEFRPVARQYWKEYFMFFSSDRPGGKGGFDLYYIGFDDPVIQ